LGNLGTPYLIGCKVLIILKNIFMEIGIMSPNYEKLSKELCSVNPGKVFQDFVFAEGPAAKSAIA